MRIATPLALRPGDEAELRKMASGRSVPAVLLASGGLPNKVIGERAGLSTPSALAVAEPGTGKSGIFRKVTAPLVAFERSVQPDERLAYAHWESRGRMLEKAVSAAEGAAAKAPPDGTLPNLREGSTARNTPMDEEHPHERISAMQAFRPR